VKIAIPSRNGRQLGGHAGRARHWLVFEGEKGGEARLAGTVELQPEQVFHVHKDKPDHPLQGIDALLARSAGEGFVNRLRKRGVDVRLTAERNAAKAAGDYLADRLAPPHAPGLLALFCKIRDRLSSDHV